MNDKLKGLSSYINSEDRFRNSLHKYRALSSGDSGVIRYYYQHVAPTMSDQYTVLDTSNLFFSNIVSDEALVHYPLTKTIGEAYARLVTSNGFDINIDNDEDSIKVLNKIIIDNHFDTLWANAEFEQTVMGNILFKVTVDEDISEYPIIELVKVDDFELTSKYNRITGYILKYHKEIDGKDYILKEIYYKEDNKHKVKYEVVCTSGSKDMIIDLNKNTSLSERVIKSFGIEKTITSENIDKLNKLYSKLGSFPLVFKYNESTSRIGEYALPQTYGIETLESGMSELASNLLDEVRKGRLTTFISEELLPKNNNGESIGLNKIKGRFEIVRGSQTSTDELLKHVQAEINSDKYTGALSAFYQLASNMVSLSPTTLGVTGLESIVASSESQQEREKLSLRSRENRLKSWELTLKELFKLILDIYNVVKTSVKKDIKDIMITFGEYSNPSEESVVNIMSNAITSGLKSIKQAQYEYYNESMTDDELKTLYIQTKIEKLIPLTDEERNYITNAVKNPSEDINVTEDDITVDEPQE